MVAWSKRKSRFPLEFCWLAQFLREKTLSGRLDAALSPPRHM
jgi:hypothetical protein